MTKTMAAKIDRPIPSRTLSRARKIARTYRIILEPSGESGVVGRALEMPGVMGNGEDMDTCARSTLFALETAIATMLESGQHPPLASSPGRKTEQVNVRLTPEEKFLLLEESSRRGFRGVSDFVRSVVLQTGSGAALRGSKSETQARVDTLFLPNAGARQRELRNLVIHGLTRTERLLMILYYYEEMPLEEIADHLGLSRDRVSRMHASVLEKLRGRLARGAKRAAG